MADLSETERVMQGLARALDSAFNGGGERIVGFMLLITPFDMPEGARTNYVSNVDRAGALAMLKEVAARFEGQAEVTGHG